MKPETLFLSTQTLEALGMRNYPEVFCVVNNLFGELNNEQLHNVGRWSFTDNQGNTTLVMPGEIPGPKGVKGIKTIQSHENNRQHGMPRSTSNIILYDKDTGQMIAQIDSTELTPIKSACESAVALSAWEKISRPHTVSLGILGGGPNAKGHIEAFLELSKTPIKLVQIFSPRQSGKLLTKTLQSKYPDKTILFNKSIENIIATSNVMVLATTSPKPLLYGSHAAGKHPKLIIGLGFHDVDLSALLKSDLVITDDPKEYIKTDLPVGEYLKKQPVNLTTLTRVMREPHLITQGVTIFVPFGLGTVDIATANHFYTKSQSLFANHPYE